MTDHANAELIAEARQLIRHSSVSVPEHANMLGRLADALEAAEGERDLFKREQVRLAARCDRAQNERDQLAAVVEKVRVFIERQSGWFRYRAEPLSTILATAPSEALHDLTTARE